MAAILQQSQPATTATAASFTTATSSKTSLDDYGLLIYDRYTTIFEPVPPEALPEDCVRLGPDDVLFLIEAPLNAVELYEAILKPRGGASLTVHKARLVPRRIRGAENGGGGRGAQRGALVQEYVNGQGKLEGKGAQAERDVRFVVLKKDVIWQLQMYYHFMWPVQLQYMSIPVRVSGAKTLRSPYAAVCYNGHRVYHKKLKALLKDTHLHNDPLARSLLPSGASPLPETLRDYMDGTPGRDAAAAYREPAAVVDRGAGAVVGGPRPGVLRRVTSNIPTVRRAVSRVSLRRSRSSVSVGRT